jgi:hypothetical protein
MDKIKCSLRKRLGKQVMSAHLNLIARQPLQQASVEIHRKHHPSATDAPGKHLRHRACARPDVQTAPAIANADLVELLGGERVVALLQQHQAGAFQLSGVLL